MSDIDTTVADSLKALDLNGRLEKLPSPTSFDHLVGGHLWGLWHPQAERLGGLEIEPREEEAPRVRGLISKQHGGYCCEWQNHSAEKDNQEHPVIDIEATHCKASRRSGPELRYSGAHFLRLSFTGHKFRRRTRSSRTMIALDRAIKTARRDLGETFARSWGGNRASRARTLA